MVLYLVHQIPQLSTAKSDFPQVYSEKIRSMTRRSEDNLTPYFTIPEAMRIIKFFEDEVLPYYELYELNLDANPEFSLHCE